MRLLLRSNTGDFSLTDEFVGDDVIPPYAILSHTWQGEEVTFKDIMDGTGQDKAGYEKIRFCGQQAERDGLRYFWVDTCCIDKSNQVILQEAINSMFRWYQNAKECYVYLSDVSITKRKANSESFESTWEPAFRESRWFTRGWTLQELLAPRSVRFFSSEGKELGSKTMLERQIHEITAITPRALQGAPLCEFSIEERISWTRIRQTTYKEDKAYSLLGMFDICMPLLYGEGEEKAFQRLRKKITKTSNGVQQRSYVTTPTCNIPFSKNEHFVRRNDKLYVPKLELMLDRECKTPIVGKSQVAPKLDEHRGFSWIGGVSGVAPNQALAPDHPNHTRYTSTAISQLNTVAVTKIAGSNSLALKSPIVNPAQPGVSDSSPESLAVDYPLFNGESLTEEQARAFLTAVIILGELFKCLWMTTPTLFALITLLRSIPPGVSKLLPDNILFHDALGREYSLTFAHFKDWSVLDALLQEQFKDCPGFSKVKQHQFGITDVDDPERMITELSWSKIVGRRKRFRMTIFISQLYMTNRLCAKCGKTVRNVSNSTSACPSCGIFYGAVESSRRRVDPIMVRNMRLLGVPSSGWSSLADKYQTELPSVLKNIRGGEDRYQPDILTRSSPSSAISSTTTEESTNNAQGTGHHEVQTEPTPGNEAKDEEADNVSESISPQQPAVSEDQDVLRRREQEELQHFRAVCIKHDNQLYDAARLGNESVVMQLLEQGMNVDDNYGEFGTPLAIAILAQNDIITSLLLTHGANPMSQIGVIGGPLRAAALYGTPKVLDAVLIKAISVVSRRASYQAQIFQDIIDDALVSIVSDSQVQHRSPASGYQSDKICSLLYAGANPFISGRNITSAFAKSFGKKLNREPLAISFLAEAWGRNLLTDTEGSYIAKVLDGVNTLPELSDAWLESCCRNIQMRNPKMLEQRVVSRLPDSQHFFMIKPHWRKRKLGESQSDHIPLASVRDVDPVDEEPGPSDFRISVQFVE